MKDLRVIGVVHSVEDFRYGETAAFLRDNIPAGARVAFESPHALDDIPYQVSKLQDDTTQFLGNLLIRIQHNQAIPLPIEDMRAFDIVHARIKRLKELRVRNIYRCDWISNYLTQYRSVRHLELAREQEADVLIIGMRHAGDLDSWGYPQVKYATREEFYREMVKTVKIWQTKPWTQKQAARARKSF